MHLNNQEQMCVPVLRMSEEPMDFLLLLMRVVPEFHRIKLTDNLSNYFKSLDILSPEH